MLLVRKPDGACKTRKPRALLSVVAGAIKMANHERATGLTQRLATYLEQRTMQESQALAEAEADQRQAEEDAQRAHDIATHTNNNRWGGMAACMDGPVGHRNL